MPVADALRQLGRKLYYPTINEGQGTAVPLNEIASVVDAHRFAETHLNTYKRVWLPTPPDPAGMITLEASDTDAEFHQKLHAAAGPQRLPFPDMWFEGNWAPFATPRINTVATAIRVTSRGLTSRDGTPTTGHSFQIFALQRNGHIVRDPVIVGLNTSPEGGITACYAAGLGDNGMYDVELDIPLPFIADILPAMWAIGMMNCRNVTTVDVIPQPRVTKKQRRPRAAAISYSTIVLPAPRNGGGSSSGGDDPRGVHLVRGHFATYTTDAPLFGKLTGTYWRPWHVRGNPEHGAVVSDYQVGGG